MRVVYIALALMDLLTTGTALKIEGDIMREINPMHRWLFLHVPWYVHLAFFLLFTMLYYSFLVWFGKRYNRDYRGFIAVVWLFIILSNAVTASMVA